MLPPRVLARLLGLSAAVLLAALATGCASTAGSEDDDPPSGTNAGPAKTDDDTVPAQADDDGQLHFGQAFTYDDGLTVVVGKPRSFEPGPYAAATKQPALSFAVKVVNKTGKPFDPNLFLITMQSGNKQASEIYDVSGDLLGTPTTKLLDGRESTWRVAYNVVDPADLVLEVKPDAGFTYESLIYTR